MPLIFVTQLKNIQLLKCILFDAVNLTRLPFNGLKICLQAVLLRRRLGWPEGLPELR